ncbi:MAG TPA: acetoin utilization protein AcuC [Spirochaetota bacterium]|nr:acetoin utilization protein AcuC [Spirochaetota bacterium]HQH96558.1 acetoin utilization protein AcuC [Spirochaetota bacterium]HQJ69730.1 acetoin utilization protein AcuC [Spirochaetota bacterium]HRS76481.1 acetoin utilization protein AcuC [Spirochaetota bacterium]HRT74911.1 acetoin utilization protein AcuC [Spirochaetota bacterium]
MSNSIRNDADVMAKNVLVYSDKLASFDFGPTHPFKPSRAKQMMDLLSRYSLLYENNQLIIEAGPFPEEELYVYHDRKYLDILKNAEKGGFTMDMLEAGLGTEDCPVVPGLWDFCLNASGGTCRGAAMLAEGAARVVFNPLGGFHHAGRDHAEGFCYINDLAVAITDLTRRGMRVAYIDIDVHFGNGVRDAFAGRKDVLCMSIHESGMTIYPWSGFVEDIGEGEGTGYTVNIPLMEGSDDEVFLGAFEAVVPPLVGAFKPDAVVAVIGGDAHRDDLLGHLNLTSIGYERAIRIINSLAPKLLVTGGGGYNVYKTAALWTLAWAAFCGLEPADAYAGLIGGMMYGPEAQSGTLRDDPYVVTGHLKERCSEYARDMVGYLKKNVFPIHGIS